MSFSTNIYGELFALCPEGIPSKEWDAFRVLYKKTERAEILPFPLQLDIELNSNCNLNCSFCIHSFEKNRQLSLIPFSVYTQIVDEAHQIGSRSIKFNYMNEPLLKDDLIKYIRYARQVGFVNIYFSTNGIFLTNKFIDELIDNTITQINISLDATTQETFFALRKSHKYHEICRNIFKLYTERNLKNKEFPLIKVSFLETSENIHEKEDFIYQWDGTADIINIQHKNEYSQKKPSEPHNKKKFICQFPFRLLVVTSELDILPCCSMNGLFQKIGNYSTMSLQEAWDSKIMRELRDIHRHKQYFKHAICRSCIG